jgi:hypothetical protein
MQIPIQNHTFNKASTIKSLQISTHHITTPKHSTKSFNAFSITKQTNNIDNQEDL